MSVLGHQDLAFRDASEASPGTGELLRSQSDACRPPCALAVCASLIIQQLLDLNANLSVARALAVSFSLLKIENEKQKQKLYYCSCILVLVSSCVCVHLLVLLYLLASNNSLNLFDI